MEKRKNVLKNVSYVSALMRIASLTLQKSILNKKIKYKEMWKYLHRNNKKVEGEKDEEEL